MGRKSIPILLKATSPEGETKTLSISYLIILLYYYLSAKLLKNWDLANMELVKHFMKKEIELVNTS